MAALADRYRIEGPLGSGGMAAVFRATDLKHDRQVAIKVIHPDVAASMGAERFLREIQITAKLNHPHILGLYDSGDAGGVLYYVMPVVEGETLRDLIDREQQLSIDDALRIAREVADALGYAHSLGLVHRDIKPENIFLSGGHAVVADFGIARAVSAAGAQSLTQTGMAVGTPAYMSPEQGAGDPNVDGRADIYALGCVLYEMLVGQVPFTGSTAIAVIARHSMDHVPPPQIVRQSIPDDLEDVILCALSKAPADRFRTAQDMVAALAAVEAGQRPKVRLSAAVRTSRMSLQAEAPRQRAWLWPAVIGGAIVLVGAGAAVMFLGDRAPARDPVLDAERRVIAVTYFEDRSADHALGPLADGMTEGLIDELSRTPALTVISRNGVAPFRGTGVATDSIAHALGAGTVVRGSLEPTAEGIRFTVRLQDATGVDIENQTFTLAVDQPLAARDSVAEFVSRSLRRSLGDEIRVRRLQTGTANQDAWLLVRRAEQARQRAETALDESEDVDAWLAGYATADSLLATAAALDPAWSEPSLQRGQLAYRQGRVLANADRQEGVDALQRALGHAHAALTAEPGAARALELRGTVYYAQWLFELDPAGAAPDSLLSGARRDLEAAVDRDPLRASAYSTLSHLYYQVDDIPGAVLAAQQAYRADAWLDVAPDVLWRQFTGSYDLGNWRQASEACDEGGRRFGQDYRFTKCQLTLMTIPGATADPARATELAARWESLVQGPGARDERRLVQLTLGGVLGRAGLADSARRVLDRAAQMPADDQALELVGIEAFMRTLAADTARAVELLRRYVAAHPGHSFRVGGDIHWWWRGLVGLPEMRGVFIR